MSFPVTAEKMKKLSVTLERDTAKLLEDLSELEFLSVNNTKVTELPENLPNLRTLEVHNRVVKIPNYPNLEILVINSCMIGDFETLKIPKLQNLRKFICEGITNVEELPEELTNLTLLSIGGSGISKIPETLKKLKTLVCDHTQVSYIPKELEELDELYITNTLIESLPKELSKLRILSAEGLNLTVPKELTNLENLDVRGNKKFDKLHEEFVNLQRVDIRGTRVKQISAAHTKVGLLLCEPDVLMPAFYYLKTINNFYSAL